MANIEVKNKDLKTSYILTSSRFDRNIYEQRIFYRIVEATQFLLEGKKLSGENYKVEATLFDGRIYTMPTSAFLRDGETDQNYTRIKQAFLHLMKSVMEYEDDKEWIATTLVCSVKLNKERGMITFEIPRPTYEALLDFSKGHSRYEFQVIMNFECVYSMRFYELMSKNKNSISYDYDDLKHMFCLENKYKQVADFVRKVIEPAKRELDEKSPYTFTYEPYKWNGTKKIKGWTFISVYQPTKRDPALIGKELLPRIHLSQFFSNNGIRHFLINEVGFTSQEIKHNIDNFEAVYKVKGNGFLKWLKSIDISTSKNPKGYIIGALRNELKQANIKVPHNATTFTNTFNFKNRIIESKSKTMSYDTFVNMKDDEDEE